MFFFSSLLLGILSTVSGEKIDLNVLLSQPILLTIFAAGLVNIAIVGGVNYGYKRVDAIVGNNISLLKVVFAAIIGGIFFHEMITIQEILGGIIIIIAVVQMNKLSQKNKITPVQTID
jgi:drug/metabolite transporter (DMT)-like permease